VSKILVIDDTLDRLSWFQQALKLAGNHEVSCAATSAEALSRFRETTFDLAFFDHDLGMLSDLDGSQLAFHILNNPEEFKIPKHVWIHSQNPVGVRNIAAKFRSADVPTFVMSFHDCLLDKEDFKDSLRNIL
jgi:CheY-like chemotaxis protein